MKILMGAVLALSIASAGCSGSDGETRYRLNGEVTFDGQPIPAGEVLFTPDGTKGQKGPQGIAPIKDGKFDTANGKGIAGGPTLVRVMGLTGPNGKDLCDFEWPMELPRADGTQNLDVPKKGGPKVNVKKSPEI